MDRISRRTVNAGSTGVATTYGYLAGGHGANSTTPLVQTITQSGTTLTYAYDDAGNITSVSDGSKTISYEYDLLGQLTRVNDPYDTTSGSTGTTWKYAYDQGGNIQSKTAYAFTTGTVGSAVKTDSFTYGDANWKDKLTAFNGTTITYDAIGNPTNDGTWNYTWIGGRQMRAMYKGEFGEQGYDEITFDYNENGLRTKKTRMYYDDATGDIGYKATNYTLHGKNIVHMSDGSNNLHFFYDAQNKPAVVIFNGTAYAYLYNLQGDVIGLLDSTGTKVVSYTYDAWGKPISKTGTLTSTLGTIQPFRYRGYVFDEETGLYYLRSRYYSAMHSRFISADRIIGYKVRISTHNLYAYCRNQPINCLDRNGMFVFILTVGLENATVSTEFDAAVSDNGSDCDCLQEIVAGAVIPMKGPPNGYLSGKNGHGDLYEGWYDSEGNIERARHHSNHGNEKNHPKNPHDHKGTKDKNGNPTLDPKGEDPNPDYQAPETETSTNFANALVGSLIVYGLYRGIKAIIGIAAAPSTGGLSLIPALAP